MRILVFILILMNAYISKAQYPPSVGQEGSDAVFYDSSDIVNWAKHSTVYRGYTDIAQPITWVTNGNPNDAVGKADAIGVSLGDGGSTIVSFSPAISNEQGADFAVFENSFDGQFLELAFVEVSSDSIHWYRFDAVSLTQTDTQQSGFSNLEASKIYNLAGKYQAFYGTPFDLNELQGNSFLNIDSVSYIRVIDVIGSISPEYSSFDSQGHMVNDPYPTPFPTGGFDLDAIGVIHERPQSVENTGISQIRIFPNPCNENFNIYTSANSTLEIYDFSGNFIKSVEIQGYSKINLEDLTSGFYSLKIIQRDQSFFQKIIVK
jgi:hypothetical protein